MLIYLDLHWLDRWSSGINETLITSPGLKAGTTLRTKSGGTSLPLVVFLWVIRCTLYLFQGLLLIWYFLSILRQRSVAPMSCWNNAWIYMRLMNSWFCSQRKLRAYGWGPNIYNWYVLSIVLNCMFGLPFLVNWLMPFRIVCAGDFLVVALAWTCLWGKKTWHKDNTMSV